MATHCYDATSAFPANEIYGMASQMRRAAVSVAANIAEGHGREGTAQFIQFLRIAQGSVKELETHLIIAERVGLIGADPASSLLAECDEIGRMLRALIRSLQRKT